MPELTEQQVNGVIELIRCGRFITEACDDLGVPRKDFYMACYTSDEVQEAKNRAQEEGHTLRKEESMAIKWQAYQQLTDNPKYATIAIWMDKTTFGLRDTPETAAPAPTAVQGLRFVAAEPPVGTTGVNAGINHTLGGDTAIDSCAFAKTVTGPAYALKTYRGNP